MNLLNRVRAYFGNRRHQAVRELILQNAQYLNGVFERSFSEFDEGRFQLLWCEIAEILGVSVSQMGEADRLDQYFALDTSRCSMNSKQEDLSYLINMESRGRPPPATPFKTVGDVLEYLLK